MEKKYNTDIDERKKRPNQEDTETLIPDEIYENIPEEDRDRIESIVSQTLISGVMRQNHPLSEKITPEHITKLIDNSEARDVRDYQERKSNRWYHLAVLVISLVFLAFLIIFLKEDKELLYKVIIAIISFAGGFGVGAIRQKNKGSDHID